MIIPDRKKAVSIILDRMHPAMPQKMAEGGEAMEQEDSHRHEILKSIAADIIEAMHSKSADDLYNALCSFIEQEELSEQEE